MCAAQDLVDQHLRERKETPAMQAVMGGTFAQQIICRSVNYRSEKEEDFYQVSCCTQLEQEATAASCMCILST